MKRTSPATIGLAVALLLLGALLIFAAAPRADVRLAGPEPGFAAHASGPAATSWNPANLALFPERSFELFGLQAGFGNNSFSMKRYGDLNGAYWDEATKQEILGSIDGDTFTFAGAVRLRAVGISVGTFAFSTETRAISDATLSKEALELLLFGNTVGRTFDLEGTGGVGVAFSEMRISAAQPLGNLTESLSPTLAAWCVGVSVKLLEGWAYGELLEANGGLTTTDELIYGNGTLRTVTATGGRGFGFDLGFSGPLGKDWTASLAFRDLFAGLNWTEGVEERTETFDVPGISLGEGEEDTIYSSEVVRTLDSYAGDLASTISVSAARTSGRLLTALHLETPAGSGVGASVDPFGGVAAAWRLGSRLALRGSAGLGGSAGAALGGGLGLAAGPVQLDLSAQSWGSLNPFASKGMGLLAALRIAI